MSVAEAPVQFTEESLNQIRDKYKRKHPDRYVEAQKITTVEQQKGIEKILLYNGIWLVLTYGADLLSMAVPWLGKGFGALVKWKFKGNWKQKQVGL